MVSGEMQAVSTSLANMSMSAGDKPLPVQAANHQTDKDQGHDCQCGSNHHQHQHPPSVAADGSVSSSPLATTSVTTPATAAPSTSLSDPDSSTPLPSSSTLTNAEPILIDPEVNDELPPLDDPELDALRDEIYSLIRSISDPEHPYSIEQLGVVYKNGVHVGKDGDRELVDIEFKPTVPHCNLATLIGLCIRTKITQNIPNVKFHIQIQPGAHQTEDQINKQLNDKERASAALENPALRATVESLIQDKEE